MKRCFVLIIAACVCSVNLTAQTKRPARNGGGWILSSKKDPMSSENKSSLSLRSDNPAFGHYPVMKIECGKKGKSVWLIYEPDLKSENVKIGDRYVMETTYLKLKFDEAKADETSGLHDRDHRGCLMLDSENILSKMLTAKKLLIEYPPLDRPKQLATFTMRDLSSKINSLKCE